MAPPPPPPTFDEVIVQFEIDKPLIKVAGVPPEEMRLDRYARTLRRIAHRRPRARGADRSDDRDGLRRARQCLEHVQSQEINEFTMEAQLRNPGRFMSTRVGDGVQVRRVVHQGRSRTAMGSPSFATSARWARTTRSSLTRRRIGSSSRCFSCDPISHTIVGDSIADYTEDIQKIKTNMMRGVLDSLAESINPKTVVNELMVNLDDALNDDLGAVIRTRGDPIASGDVHSDAVRRSGCAADHRADERHAGAADGAYRCSERIGSEGDSVIHADRR